MVEKVVEKSNPFRFKFPTTHNELEVWQEVDLKPKRKGRPSSIEQASMTTLYDHQRPIKKKKLEDLKELLKYLPPIHSIIILKVE